MSPVPTVVLHDAEQAESSRDGPQAGRSLQPGECKTKQNKTKPAESTQWKRKSEVQMGTFAHSQV